MAIKFDSTDLNSFWIYIFTFILGLLIITFNVMGYDVLFSDSPLIPFIPISPIGLMLFVVECAVLAWTSAVIKNWPDTSRILKAAMVIVVCIFWFLSYAGISSYLNTLATSEVNKVREYKQQAENNSKLVLVLTEQVVQIRNELEVLRRQRTQENQRIADLNQAIDSLSFQASERRRTASNCQTVADCRASVQAFVDQIERVEQEILPIRSARDRKDSRIVLLEQKLDEHTQEINSIKSEETRRLNDVANAESNHEVKKSAYASTISDAFRVLNIELEDPFQVFVNIIALVIYPMYFSLNLYTSLLSESNKLARQRSIDEKSGYRKSKKLYKSMRYHLGLKIALYLRARLLRKKREYIETINIRSEIWKNNRSHQKKLSKKVLSYLRVWAYRRKKVVNIAKETVVEIPVEIEKIVEIEKVVEIEVEVEVERLVEIEKIVEKEVAKEVDRIVEVPTEVPVFVDKVKTVPEPFFVKDPQIIIHERIIPVPENITGLELEELLNAQPRLNQVARGSESETFDSSASEGKDSDERESSTATESGKGAAA